MDSAETASSRAAVPQPSVRVLVKGSSLVLMTPERAPERGAYTFPRWLQQDLEAAGHRVECWNAGVISEPTGAAFDAWEAQVMAWMPDVVVLGYGYYECIHALLPHWLERHVNSPTWRRGAVRTRYRSYLLRPVWKVLAQTQRRVDVHLPPQLFGRRLRRVLDDYELLVTRTRAHGHPLVLLLELLPPGGRAGTWFPGMAQRIAAMNRGLRDLVDRLDDPDVRVVPVATLAEDVGGVDEAVPDGLHYSPQMRRLLGQVIAREADAWLRCRPAAD